MIACSGHTMGETARGRVRVPLGLRPALSGLLPDRLYIYIYICIGIYVYLHIYIYI